MKKPLGPLANRIARPVINFSLTSMRVRFALTLFGIVTAIVLLLWLSINLYFREYVEGQKILGKRQAMDTQLVEIESQLNSVEALAGIICYDHRVQQLMQRYLNSNGFEKYAAASDIQKIVNGISVIRSDIVVNMFLRDSKGNICFMDTGYYSDISIYASEWTDAGNGMGYSPVLRLQNTKNMSDVTIIQFRYDFKDLSSPTISIGELIINIKAENIFAPLTKDSDEGESFVILSRNSMYPAEFDGLDLPAFDTLRATPVYKAEDYIILSLYVDRLDSLFVRVLPTSTVVNYVNDINRIIIYIFVFGLLLTVLMSFIFSNLMTKPVLELNDVMARVTGGDLSVRIRKLPGDEFGSISVGMNLMLDEVRDLLRKIELVHKKERETELRLFMAQINPHFLYNTLNSIIYLSRAGKSEDTIYLTRALITILRRNIHIGSSPVKLRDEIDYLNNYMSIMKQRYGDMICMDIDVSDSLMDKYIYPMLLYPLVENSIYHGIAPKGVAGKITLRITDEEETVFFQVTDDGVGIVPEKIAEIKAGAEKLRYETSASIGIANIQNRLWGHYSSSSTLMIESVPGEGTQVSFRIDKKNMDSPA